MTGHWTVFAVPVECGHASGSHAIAAGAPVRELTRTIRRCADHSAVPVDWTAVDAARFTLEQARQAEGPQEISSRFSKYSPKIAPQRRLVRLAEIAKDLPFDAKAAAARLEAE